VGLFCGRSIMGMAVERAFELSRWRGGCCSGGGLGGGRD
jgi:hypothetical protein